MDILNLFDLHRKKCAGDLGIEVEVEGDNLPRINTSKWRTDYDGSLKGESYEYVFNKPLSLDDSAKALKYLDKRLSGSNLIDSVRCGVHVHVNVQSLTVMQLYNFFTLYSMFEDILLDYCGIGRRGNLFCLPLNSSYNLVDYLREGFLEYPRNSYSDEWRYCAMNIKSLRQYGSLEFRAMRRCDLDKVHTWSHVLLNLREAAKQYDNPEEIIYQASVDGFTEFFNSTVQVLEASQFQNYRRKLANGVNESLAIAYTPNLINKVDKYEDFY